MKTGYLICHKYTTKQEKTPWKCQKYGMSLSKVDRSNSNPLFEAEVSFGTTTSADCVLGCWLAVRSGSCQWHIPSLYKLNLSDPLTK